MLKGIDVSSHNGEINWNETKSQVDFAIIRLGYGDNVESLTHICDRSRNRHSPCIGRTVLI